MNTKLFISLIVILLSIGSVQGQIVYNKSCGTNGYLVVNSTYYVNDVANNFFQNESCDYGCSLSGTECNELVKDNSNFMMFPIIFFFAAGIAGFIASSSEKIIFQPSGRKVFQFLFIGMTLGFTILGTSLLTMYPTLTVNDAVGLANAGWIVMVWGTITIILIMLALTMFNIFKDVKIEKGPV